MLVVSFTVSPISSLAHPPPHPRHAHCTMQVDALISLGDVDPSTIQVDSSLLGDSIDSSIVGGLTFSISSSSAAAVGSVGE